MSAADDFTLKDNWRGSYYELAVQLGLRTAPDADARLARALRALWSGPGVEGGFRERSVAPTEQAVVAPEEMNLEQCQVVYGRVRLPTGVATVCVSHVVREEDEGGMDWLTLSLPTGGLERAEPRLEYPIGGAASRSWREPLDCWFVETAQVIATATPFRCAVIGEDVSGFDISTSQAERRVSLVTIDASGEAHWLPPTSW